MRIGRTQHVIVAEPLVHPVPGPGTTPEPVERAEPVDTAPTPAPVRPTAPRVVVPR